MPFLDSGRVSGVSTRAVRTSARAASPIRIRPPEVLRGEWVVSGATSSAALRLVDLTPLTKVLVRCWPEGGGALGVAVCPMGRTMRDPDGNLVVGSGPDEWLILGPSGSAAAVIARLEGQPNAEGQPGATGQPGDPGDLGDPGATVVDLTHGGVVLRLTGEDARRCLNKLCALNLDDKAMPDGSVRRSLVAEVETTVIRDDQGSTPSYLLHSDRSSGQYLVDQLLDAGGEFGVEVDGYPDREL